MKRTVWDIGSECFGGTRTLDSSSVRNAELQLFSIVLGVALHVTQLLTLKVVQYVLLPVIR
jgi:hypothetical protein